MIIDVDSLLYKVQCKHCKVGVDKEGNDEFIEFKSTWTSHNSSGYVRHVYKMNEVDYFATMYNGECYLVPFEVCGKVKRLRIAPPKNNQTKGIQMLRDYRADIVIGKIKESIKIVFPNCQS